MQKYLEPRTDVPAGQDWSTRLAFAAARPAVVEGVVFVLTVATLVATFFVPESPGNTLARYALVFWLFVATIPWTEMLRERRVRRSGLLDEPWRRVPADVAKFDDYLLTGGIALKGPFGDLLDVVRERGEIFLCGPDENGRALVRVAGSAWPHQAEVVRGEFGTRPGLERPLVPPADDEQIRTSVRVARSLIPFLWLRLALASAAIVVALGAAVMMPSPTGIVAAALLATGLISISRAVEMCLRERDVVKAAAGSREWQPVPMTLFPWHRGQHVAGIADLPEGPALVRFPWPQADQVANVVDTGVLWIAGRHGNTLAVSLPGLSMPVTIGLTCAVVRPVAESDPMSWAQRLKQPDFSALPR